MTDRIRKAIGSLLATIARKLDRDLPTTREGARTLLVRTAQAIAALQAGDDKAAKEYAAAADAAAQFVKARRALDEWIALLDEVDPC